MRRLPLVVACAVLAGLLTAPPATAQTPSTLLGETLFGPLTNFEITCNFDPTGQTLSSVSYSATGVATGPYPGTFTETGTAVFHFQSPVGNTNLNPFETFTVDFTIESGTTQITGHKTLPAVQDTTASCAQSPDDAAGSVAADLAYVATISTPTGEFRDEGMVGTNAVGNRAVTGEIKFGSAEEMFRSSLAEPVPIPPPLPTSKDQCKNGGWHNFPAAGFKNQGDCVSSVATGGRNQPAGG